MNKPSYPVTPAGEASPPYDLDSYGWSIAQARLIRAGDVENVDWENVAEEIESLGKSEQNSAESALRVLMSHMLKWEHQPARRGRSWMLTIAEQRLRYQDILDQNPSLKAKRDEMRARAYRRARLEAAREADLDPTVFPDEAPGWETILDEPFDMDR